MLTHVCKVIGISLFLGVALRAQPAAADPAEMTRKIESLTAIVEKLQARVDTLEAKLASTVPIDGSAAAVPVHPTALLQSTSAPVPAASTAAPAGASGPQVAAVASAGQPQAPGSSASSAITNLLGGTTVNIGFDGYYGYNFNDPIGRVNLLRAYDVSSNEFILSQANLILENAPDPANGKRFGLRLDLQYGQATATLQGNPLNEPRPEIYRNIFQAYGTYVVPLGTGLTVDFGKWSSSLGMEGNYNKDQMNYSRSYLFNFLPYYHMGVRANYKFNDKVAANYWVINGTNQTEPYNGFKDEMFGINVTPTKNISWTVNYYLGQEHPDVVYLPNDTSGNLPSLQGTPFLPIENPPKGKLHIFDSYVSWQASNKLTLAMEGDYVLEREYTYSAPEHVSAGAWYARYQLSPRWAVAGRFEYFSDRGGLFSGKTQALKEGTFTLEKKLAEGFLLRAEWRRDWSNQPYFYTDTLGILKNEQTTATLGLLWWFGGKQGAW